MNDPVLVCAGDRKATALLLGVSVYSLLSISLLVIVETPTPRCEC